jgi:hypothetical protein
VQWDALRFLWRMSRLERVRKCRRFTTTGVAGIARRGDRAHYTGLQTCGSVWSCPVCSARIQAKRTDELVQAVEHAHAHGLKIAMGTLTMRHQARRRLRPMWDALSDAFAAAMGRDRGVRRAKKRLGVVGWVRRVEATHGANGWHLHAHALIFYSGGGDLGELGEMMWRGWIRRLTFHGLDADREHGLVLRELDLEQAREEVAGYLTKATYEQTSGSAARELAGQMGKEGRRGNRTPFDVLADLTHDGLASDLAIWSEWERTSKGRRALTWSKGLRAQLLAEDERSDEDIAADNDGDQVDVAGFDGATWGTIVAKRLEVELLEAVEAVPIEDSYGAVERFCAAHGLGKPWPRE